MAKAGRPPADGERRPTMSARRTKRRPEEALLPRAMGAAMMPEMRDRRATRSGTLHLTCAPLAGKTALVDGYRGDALAYIGFCPIVVTRQPVAARYITQKDSR